MKNVLVFSILMAVISSVHVSSSAQEAPKKRGLRTLFSCYAYNWSKSYPSDYLFAQVVSDPRTGRSIRLFYRYMWDRQDRVFRSTPAQVKESSSAIQYSNWYFDSRKSGQAPSPVIEIKKNQRVQVAVDGQMVNGLVGRLSFSNDLRYFHDAQMVCAPGDVIKMPFDLPEH